MTHCAFGCVYICFCCRFTLVQKHTVEFNQLAMANSEGSEAMLNRVMTKDNIGVAVLLELRKELTETAREWAPRGSGLGSSHSSGHTR